MDSIYERLNDDMDITNEYVGESEIQKYYAGKTVFLTGSTGFMGKCLIEKLLRGCPDLKRIYVLVRPKRGSSAEDRIKEYLDDVLFGRVRKMYPDFASKIYLVEGDLIQDGMALSEKDKNMMIDEVNIIFHNASNVKFNVRMSTALKINVMGTKAMLDLANQCKHIEGFLYVSTAYSHCYRKNIMEEAYPSPADMNMVQELIATDMATPKGLSEAAVQNIIGKFPNTYTFTKAIAEGLVNDAGKQVSFPCIVYRPSIVVSTWHEPLRGWCGNLNGPAALMIGYGLGIVHVGYMGNSIADLIPVDMSINSIIASMWDAVNRPNGPRSLVYNFGSSTAKPMTVKGFRDICIPNNDSLLNPTNLQLWHTFMIFTDSLWCFVLYHILFHFVPAIIADFYFLVNGKKTQALSALKKLTMSYKLLIYFFRGNWKIDISEMNKVVDRMSLVDRDLFFCDIRKLDWADYGMIFPNGLRVYILKDPMSTVQAARRKARFFKTIHNTIKYTLILLFVYVIATKLGMF